MFCLKAPARIQTSVCLEMADSFFKHFLSKISNIFKDMINQNAKYRDPLYLTAAYM